MKVLYTIFAVLLLSLSANALAVTITIEPDAPSVGNCFPFGGDDDPGDPFDPYAGFVYQDIPAFSMAPGDTIAFDTSNIENNVAIELDIELAATTVNGGNIASGGFTKIVSNNQQAADPNGNATQGDYELAFTAEASFDFAGGGLIIRFSNESVAYAADNDCTQNLVSGTSADTSGYFVQRFYSDADGLEPYDGGGTDRIGAFQLVVGEFVPAVPVPANNTWSLILLMLLFTGSAIITLRRST